jgi:hypothetical protein
MAIKVKLNGSTVTVHPMVHHVDKGNRPVQWGPHENSDTFTFDDPPITFDDPDAPISDITATGDSASGTDDNSASADTDYGYHVHLIDAGGNHITFPPTGSRMRAGRTTQTGTAMQAESMMVQGDPVIRNRPT